MVCIIGVDFVGMLIVFEVIVVCEVGFDLFGLFLVINYVVGVIDVLFDYVEVIVVGK